MNMKAMTTMMTVKSLSLYVFIHALSHMICKGVSYIRQRFEEKNKNPRDKQIYSHVTMATDKTNVERVFGDVQHIVINTSLARGGLI